MPLHQNGYKPRINSLRVGNYRSLGDPTELSLGDLTALVGPNGSGKSNICDAFRFVADVFKMGLEGAIAIRHGLGAIRRWSSGGPNDLWFAVTVDFAPLDEENSNDQHPTLSAEYRIRIAGSGSKNYHVKYEYASLSRTGNYPSNGFLIRDGSWIDGPKDLRPQVAALGLALPLMAGDERFRPLADALRDISIYSIFPDDLRNLQKPDSSKPMSENGTNWCSILKDLDVETGSLDLIAAIGQLTGDIDDFRVRQMAGYLVTEFRHGQSTPRGKNGRPKPRWFEASQESDGTLRMAGILTALIQHPSPTLLGIEEPELTVHPGAIPLLYDHIKEASRRGQVILTTHSPDLLALLKADEVRVVERHDGITTVAPMDEFQRQAVEDRLFTPGDLLRMEGLKQARPIQSPREI